MRYIKFLVATAVSVSVCLVMSGCDTASVVADNQPIKGAQVKNADARSTKINGDSVAANGSSSEGECCSSLSPVGSNDFVPAAVTSKHQEGQFVAQLRVWNDYEGLYSTNAELVSVAIDSRTVKLLKDNGVTIHVPISQLSRHDKNYVNAFVDECYAKNDPSSRKIVDSFND